MFRPHPDESDNTCPHTQTLHLHLTMPRYLKVFLSSHLFKMQSLHLHLIIPRCLKIFLSSHLLILWHKLGARQWPLSKQLHDHRCCELSLQSPQQSYLQYKNSGSGVFLCGPCRFKQEVLLDRSSALKRQPSWAMYRDLVWNEYFSESGHCGGVSWELLWLWHGDSLVKQGKGEYPPLEALTRGLVKTAEWEDLVYTILKCRLCKSMISYYHL
jgi:hypothetical protein